MQSYEKDRPLLQGSICPDSKLGKARLMLFDGYLRFTSCSKECIDEEDMKRRMRISIITSFGLKTSLRNSVFLDMSVPGDLPGTLYRLYDYVLTICSRQTSTKILKSRGSGQSNQELREAWAEMLTQNPEDTPSSEDQQWSNIATSLNSFIPFALRMPHRCFGTSPLKTCFTLSNKLFPPEI